MIDPNNVCNFDRNTGELEEFLIFCICVAGKKATTIAPAIDKVLKEIQIVNNSHHELRKYPLLEIKKYVKNKGEDELAILLKKHGIGCFNNKAKSLIDVSKCNVPISLLTLEDLENFRGIGPKTARFFLLNTKKDMKLAVLDTHILKFLRLLGFDTPSATPSNSKEYNKWEEIWLEICEAMNINSATLDLGVWRLFSWGLKKIRQTHNMS